MANYLKNHSYYNATIHTLAGVGIGILITYPLVGSHPLRWAVALLAVSLLGHFYPLVVKK